jgi:hypothetical protein
MRNLLILAKWLAAKANVDLEQWNQETAAITELDNGRKVIYIPRHWYYTVDPEAADLLEGVIDHEALGHGRFTDLRGRQKAEAAKLIKWNALSSAIINILEDVYIENRAINTYPGVKANLSRTVEILRNRDFFGSSALYTGKEDPGSLITTGFLNILRCNFIPGQHDILLENSEFYSEVLEKQLGRTWTEVLAIASEVKDSESTQDNIDLTIRIMDKLKDISKSKPQDSQKGEAGDGENSDEGFGEASEESGDGKAEAPPQTGEGQPGDGASTAQNGQESSDGPYTEAEIEAAKAIIAGQNAPKPVTEITDGASGQINNGCGKGAGSGDLKDSKKTTSIDPVAVRVSKQLKNSYAYMQMCAFYLR